MKKIVKLRVRCYKQVVKSALDQVGMSLPKVLDVSHCVGDMLEHVQDVVAKKR